MVIYDFLHYSIVQYSNYFQRSNNWTEEVLKSLLRATDMHAWKHTQRQRNRDRDTERKRKREKQNFRITNEILKLWEVDVPWHVTIITSILHTGCIDRISIIFLSRKTKSSLKNNFGFCKPGQFSWNHVFIHVFAVQPVFYLNVVYNYYCQLILNGTCENKRQLQFLWKLYFVGNSLQEALLLKLKTKNKQIKLFIYNNILRTTSHQEKKERINE